jgi:hypothetical protein
MLVNDHKLLQKSAGANNWFCAINFNPPGRRQYRMARHRPRGATQIGWCKKAQLF